MSSPAHPNHPHEHLSATGEPSVPVVESDQDLAPRPEEEIADQLRAEPDDEGRGGTST
ncbi:hypothetical protein ACPYO6_00320 [Georgenia sp. Z1344]|uniref:hypothetical protein n=1 Tax=Georgenia sp. Z1344 TaxID=3416706 RepID=UPI003CF9E334